MASGTATVTGQTGPGATVTSLVLNQVRNILFDFENNMVHIYHLNEAGKTFKLSYQGIATVTFSISGSVTTVTIST